MRRLKNAIKDDAASSSLITKLDDDTNYSLAVRNLDRLHLELNVHITQRDAAKARSARMDQPARQYVQREGAVLLSLSDPEVEAVARKVINARCVTDEILESVSLHRTPIFKDEADTKLVSDIEKERATVMLLEYAVKLQRKEVMAQKNAAITRICGNLKPQYHSVLQRVASALLELGAALEEEKQFTLQLTSQDKGFASSLSPKPLSELGILANPEVAAWIREAERNGLIDEEQAYAMGSVCHASV